MNRRNALASALVAAALFALAAAPAHADSDADAASSTAARESATVSVPVRTMDGMRAFTGKLGAIDIQLGNSRPFTVGLDSGFTGLLLIPGAWSSQPGGVTLGRRSSTVSLSDGQRVRGFAGKASLTISGVRSVNPVPFVYTTSDSPFFQALRSTGVHGLLGVGVKGSNSMTNPLASLPGELGVRWSMHYSRNNAKHGPDAGTLVLGALPPTQPTMVFQMPPNGKDVNGAQLWDDHATPACWTFGRLAERCVPTTFDSGGFSVLRAFGISGPGLQTDANGDLRFGTPVSLAAPGSAFTGWSYRSGQRASVNRTLAYKRGKPAVNTGNAIFFDFTITYNTVSGRLYLSNPVGKASRP